MSRHANTDDRFNKIKPFISSRTYTCKHSQILSYKLITCKISTSKIVETKTIRKYKTESTERM